MKLLGVNCSPRKVNSHGILKLMLDSVEEPTIETEIVNLGDYTLKHCLGCCACLLREPYECIQRDDDLGTIQEKFFAADGFIFAVPVYIMTVPGILKTLIDRCTNWSHVYPFAGKHGAIVTTLAAPAFVARGTVDYMRSWLRLLGIIVSGELSVFTVGGYGGPMDVAIGDIPGVKAEAEALVHTIATDMIEKPCFHPDAADLGTFRVLRQKAAAIGGHDREMWEKHGWLDKDHWSYQEESNMERQQTTLWPADSMAISPEHYLRQHFGFPVALVKQLYPILGREETLKLVRDAMLEEVRLSTSGWSTNKEARTFAEYMQGSKNMGSSILTGPLPAGSVLVSKTTQMDFSTYKLGENSFSFKITKCLWSEIFRELDATEFGKTWICDSDFPRAKKMHPKLELKRTQTIMEGAPFCDFCYQWKD